MSTPFPINVQQFEFLLLPERALFWPLHKTLIISDPHIGKAGHFRKSGIAIPQAVFIHDLQRLVTLIMETKAETLIVTGDFFHSIENKEILLFKKWRKDFSYLHIDLIMGNHDILPQNIYTSSKIICHTRIFEKDGLFFCHDFAAMQHGIKGFCLCGHIHPGVHLRSKGKQSLLLPCFHFTKKYGVLPAFGAFTGAVPVRQQKGDKVIALANKELIEIKSGQVL